MKGLIRAIVPKSVVNWLYNFLSVLVLKRISGIPVVGWCTTYTPGFKVFHGNKNVSIGRNVSLVNTLLNAGDKDGSITIEDNVIFGHDVALLARGHDYTKRLESRHLSILEKPILIKEGAWIGSRALILGGVTVGSNSVVGAGSIVTKNVGDNTVVAGNPAREIRKIKFQETPGYNGKYYDKQYFKVREYQDLDLFLKRMIRGLLPDDGKTLIKAKALDIACGVGIYCKFLGKLGIGEVHGIDFSESAIKLAKENFREGRFVVGDSKKLPYKDNTFDLILNAHMVEHLTDEDITSFMRESLRVLKQNGKILIITPNGWCPARFLFPKAWFYDPSHINFSSAIKLSRMLKSVGFSETKISQKLYPNKNDELGKYIPPKGYYGLSSMEKLLPGTFELALTAANSYPFVLFRDVAYVSAMK